MCPLFVDKSSLGHAGGVFVFFGDGVEQVLGAHEAVEVGDGKGDGAHAGVDLGDAFGLVGKLGGFGDEDAKELDLGDEADLIGLGGVNEAGGDGGLGVEPVLVGVVVAGLAATGALGLSGHGVFLL